ncbi:putative oxidoreductase, partial [Lachnellula suecica]
GGELRLPHQNIDFINPAYRYCAILTLTFHKRIIMPQSKVIILTGASRGIGLAMAHYLLRDSHKLVLVARTAEPLEKLKSEYPGQVEFVAADLADFSNGPKAIDLALKSFSRIDGLILNHGTLSPVGRVSESTIEEWRAAYDVNFFSALAFIKPALAPLRQTRGRIIMTSSGAATNAYSTWGAYGSSKAALNHLAMTLTNEEPEITTVAIRPGVVDTDMQKEVRGHGTAMDDKDTKKFKSLHEEGKLLRPEQPGNVMARLALGAERELSGKLWSWNDKELSSYQDPQ